MSLASLQIVSYTYAERIYLWLLRVLINRLDNPEGVLEAVEQRYFKKIGDFNTHADLEKWLKSNPDSRVIPASPAHINRDKLIIAQIADPVTPLEEESSIFRKEYVIAGIVILSAFWVYYYRTDIWKYFTSPDGPSPRFPKIIEIDGELYKDRVERVPLDTSSMS